MATVAAAAARHNAALLVPKVGFFLFFGSKTLELGFLFVLSFMRRIMKSDS